MVRSAASKVMWVGRATVFLVGLSMILALVFGVASMALGADGDFFKVGRTNLASAVSVLSKSGAGPALSLKVGSGAPLAVNSSTKVAKLNADRLDSKDSSAFATGVNGKATSAAHADNADVLGGKSASSLMTKGTSVINGALGPLPKQANFTSNGGPLLILASGSAWRPCSVSVPSGQPALTQMAIILDGQTKGFATIYTNECDVHHAFPATPLLVTGVGAGTHTLKLDVGSSFTQADSNDRFDAVVIELSAP
ncbi:MAG: hypothetical protein M3R38_33185 [Actinomycetota bacterium]|nr:hypothetical protein [Actinomycetota bacterium]